MKKILILSLLFLAGLELYAQKVIENPAFSATTANYVKITRVELYDTITKIDFEVSYFPKDWIRVSSKETYIQDSNGGEKLFVINAEGIELNEKHWTPESGVNHYTLFFPAIDKKVQKIDYQQKTRKIFDIDITGEQTKSLIPEEIQGNWLKPDGSNKWVYGIYEDIVIYNSSVWESIRINKKGKKFELSLQKGSQKAILYIKKKKDKLLIGSSPENMELYSKEKSYDPAFTLEDYEEYKPPVFNTDTAIYKGYIYGYHPKMGSTGMAYLNNIITGDQNSHLISIEANGSFSCKIPMIHSSEILIRMLNSNDNIFIEPGKTTFHYIDLNEYTADYKGYQDYLHRERKSLFMGDHAQVTKDLFSMDSISYYNNKSAQKEILDMTGNDYKKYCLDIMSKELEDVAQFAINNAVSKKALQIKNMKIKFRTQQRIVDFNNTKRAAYRIINKVPREQREVPLEPEVFEPAFYDFIEADKLNDPVSLLSGIDYYILIKRISFLKNIRPDNNYFYSTLIETIKKNNIPLTPEEDQLLKDQFSGKAITSFQIQADPDTLPDPLAFLARHKDLINSVAGSAYNQTKINNLNKYFGLEEGLATDIMFAQRKISRIKGRQKPFTEKDKNEINGNISNEFIIDFLMSYSDKVEKEIQEKLERNKRRTGYVINETPQTKGDELFDAIIKKYKGKVVFVDFWATWCSPCRKGMETIKPLKEELKDKEIEFVYITNHTSPEDTWNMMVPDIKGEHYRLEKDKWNLIASKFNISGIPHYIIVDKEGNVVNDHVYFASSNEQLRKMLDKYLNY